MKPKRSISVVHDDDLIQNAFAEFLPRKSFEIGIAENVMERLNIFIDKAFDLVLTGLVHLARNQPSSTKIAVMTGDDADAATELLKERWNSRLFFAKPFKVKNICEILMPEAQVA